MSGIMNKLDEVHTDAKTYRSLYCQVFSAADRCSHSDEILAAGFRAYSFKRNASQRVDKFIGRKFITAGQINADADKAMKNRRTHP